MLRARGSCALISSGSGSPHSLHHVYGWSTRMGSPHSGFGQFAITSVVSFDKLTPFSASELPRPTRVADERRRRLPSARLAGFAGAFSSSLFFAAQRNTTTKLQKRVEGVSGHPPPLLTSPDGAPLWGCPPSGSSESRNRVSLAA